MAMLGEGQRPTPSIQVPPWPVYDDPAAGAFASPLPVSGVGGGDYSPHLLGEEVLAALQRFLPSNEPHISDDGGDEEPADPPLAGVDAYSCDDFRMYEFKVRRCARGQSHDWTECPYAHPGEKARRRDPRRFRYSGVACPDFRKGSCRRGDACEFAHGVFECWLHPTRYRTQPCKDGTGCRRRVCFFAHTPEQLRAAPPSQETPRAAPDSYDGSPLRLHGRDAHTLSLLSSPASTLNSPPMSPPLSPCGAYAGRSSLPTTPSVSDVLVSLRQLQLGKESPPSPLWLMRSAGGIGSPRGFNVRPVFCSLPSTPTRTSTAGRDGQLFDRWDEPAERVESGRDLRAKIYEKLSKQNSMERWRGEEEEDSSAAATADAAATPDVEWVSELVQ